MLKHENHNFETINKNLWAVRFSLIPFIPQISVSVNYTDNLSKEQFLLLESGLLLLNKDAKTYSLLKAAFVGVMKLKPRQIQRELNLYSIGALKKNDPKSLIYHAALLVEKERRKIKKGGVT